MAKKTVELAFFSNFVPQSFYDFMKISYNWLNEYLDHHLNIDELAQILTNTGLEVDGVETFECIKGSLQGVVVGYIKTKTQHPNADRLSITTVDIGTGEDLQIVCGAPNVAQGQKVVVAPVGTTIYPKNGEAMLMKKTKIRGEISNGMICAADEIGIGTDHEGIVVLPQNLTIGMPLAQYYDIEKDFTIEIGLTPNRNDAFGHIGVAKDVLAYLNQHKKANLQLKNIETGNFPIFNNPKDLIAIENEAACPRFSGILINNVFVQPSPDWLQNKLKAIGINPINNVVDVTNYVMYETGKPIHAFDADQIEGLKIRVKFANEGEKITLLDKKEYALHAHDLCICNQHGKPMALAGIMGGLDESISQTTSNVFIESAYFDPATIRKTAKQHNLKTDASFRFERGSDWNLTIISTLRAAKLMCELTGGSVSSDVFDAYPTPILECEVEVWYAAISNLIGVEIDKNAIKSILMDLDFVFIDEDTTKFRVRVPSYRTDVSREVDVIEEILRIYGLNTIPLEPTIRYESSFPKRNSKNDFWHLISSLLASNAFFEVWNNSLTSQKYAFLDLQNRDQQVKMLNPISEDLSVLRTSMVFGGLQNIAHNSNRQRKDLKLFEFGRTYLHDEGKYIENNYLCLWLTGNKNEDNWKEKSKKNDFYDLKNVVSLIMNTLKLKLTQTTQTDNSLFAYGLLGFVGDKKMVEMGELKKMICSELGVKQSVFYAQIDWQLALKYASKQTIRYQELPRFPEVRRDLSVLLDQQIEFGQIETLAYKTEKTILKNVSLFDIYVGEKINKDKKSYAISFTLQDANQTLTEKQIDTTMQRIIAALEQDLGIEIRT